MSQRDLRESKYANSWSEHYILIRTFPHLQSRQTRQSPIIIQSPSQSPSSSPPRISVLEVSCNLDPRLSSPPLSPPSARSPRQCPPRHDAAGKHNTMTGRRHRRLRSSRWPALDGLTDPNLLEAGIPQPCGQRLMGIPVGCHGQATQGCPLRAVPSSGC